LSVIATVVTVAVAPPTSTAKAATAGVVTNYTDSSVSGPVGVAKGNDGALWFTNNGNNSIGRLTTGGAFSAYTGSGSGPNVIKNTVAGNDGNLWYTNSSGNSIGKITTAGVITTYTNSTVDQPDGIVQGSDNNLWFTNYANNSIGSITTSGTISNYTNSTIDGPADIAAGPDSALWFTNQKNSSIGRITTSGTVTNFTDSTIDWPNGIDAGSDGNLWFTNQLGNSIGKITTSGTVTKYTDTTISDPVNIRSGPDGALWYGNYSSTGGTIGSITTSGTVSAYSNSTIDGPLDLTVGPDKAIWFANNSNNSIGRVTTSVTSPIAGALTAAEAPTSFVYCRSCGGWVAVGTSTNSPVNTESGNFYHTFNDVSIPGRSYPLAITRTYNSQNASTNGAFGYGWNFNYGMSLSCSGTTATITQEDSSQATFTTSGSCTSGTWAPSAPRFIATLTYNSGSSTWTFVRNGQDTFTFNSSGQLTQEQDLNGYTTSFSYTSGNLTTITDPASRTLSLTWTGSNITKVTDSNVSGNTRTVTYSYDANGNLISVTDVNGGITDMAYDSSHRMTLMRMPNFHSDGALGSGPSSCTSTPTTHTVNNHYDSSSRVDCQWDAKGNKTTFAYSGSPQTDAGGSTIITDPVGNEVQDVYSYGLRTSTTRGYGTSLAATTSFTYDPSTLALTAETDPNNNVTKYEIDSNGNIVKTTDPLSRVTTKTYNSFNEVLTSTDGNGVTTTNTYDSNGNLLTTSTPLTNTSATATNCTSPSTAVAMAQATCNTYGNSSFPGDVTQVTDPNGKNTYFHYDANGYQDEVKDPLGNVSGSVRNSDGWMTASYTPKASCTWNSSPPTGCSSTYETQYSYVIPGGSATEEFGDVGTITDPLSHTTKYTYDANRNKLTMTDGDGNANQYAYDADNNLCWTLPGSTSSNACASPPTNARVTDYNSDGTVKDQKDGKSNAILTFGYNALDQVTSTTDALSNVTSYTYDGVGNMLTKLDPVTGATCTGTKVGCTTYTYDADNELKTVSYSDSSSENVTATTYDSDGQRTATTDGTGSSSWAFDSLHRLTSYTNGNSAAVTYGYTYGSGPTYDLKNQVRSIGYPNSVGTVTQSWNDNGTLASVTDWNSKQTTFSYDANSNETGQTVPSTTNVTDTFGFNAADRMTSVSDSNGSTLFSATYTRDSNDQLSSDNSQNSNQADYKYTALNQLCYAGSSSTNACSSPPTSAYPYAFDNADNLTNNNGTTQQYNNADELCWSISGSSSNACSSAPSHATTYTYDNKGNRTVTAPYHTSDTCYTYDQPNRLTKIQTGSGSTCTHPTTVGTYAYDGDGMRESKVVGSTTTQFTWDGVGGNVLQQYDGTTKTSFLYGPGGMPVEQIGGSTSTYLHHDQLGSTRLVTDSAGSTLTATTITYQPYGAVVSTSGSLTTPLMFSGQYKDSESGLYQLRARYYDPATAQFLTVDPAVSLTRSPYAYVMGNPLNASDTTGLWYVPPPIPAAQGDTALCAGTAEVPVADAATCGSAGVLWLAVVGAGVFDFLFSGSSSSSNTGPVGCSETGNGYDPTLCPGGFPVPQDFSGCQAKKYGEGDLLNPSGPQLSEAEKQAVRDKQAGLPYDQALYNSAVRKLNTGEKYRDQRQHSGTGG
jgi:RHS repeat-associated protein